MLGCLVAATCAVLLFGVVSKIAFHRGFAYGHHGGGHGPWGHRHGGGHHHGKGGCGHKGRRHRRLWDDEEDHDDRDRREEDEGPPWRFRDASTFEDHAGRAFSEKLKLRPDQRDAVASAARAAWKAGSHVMETLKDSRDEIADAVRGAGVDDIRLKVVFDRHDEALAEARQDLVEALRKAHSTLDPDQRGRLADWIAKGRPGRWV